jgi:UDP-glucose 4-epimerase
MTGKPRILITGGFGNLGSWLSEHFYDQGYHVTILANRVRKLEHVKYEVVQADISNYLELKERLTAEFDYCIHTASYNEHFHENYAEKALRINSLGTRNLIEVLKHGQIKKFVYFSTFHVYGNSYDFIDESSPPSPLNDYASTHLFAEYYLKQFYHTDRFPSVICRLTNSYGAPKSIDSTKWYLVLNDLVKSAYEKGVIKLSSNGEASRDFVWMGDVCEVTKKLLVSDIEFDTFNLSSGQTFKVIDLANAVSLVYKQRCQKEVGICVNQNDDSKYRVRTVSNDKLLNAINYKFSNKLEGEIIKIFELLESSNG